MKNNNKIVATDAGSPQHSGSKGPSRRKFLSQVGAALAGGAVFGKAALPPANPARASLATALPAQTSLDPRVRQSYLIRKAAANAEAHIPVPPHTTNGDEQRYPDKSGTYTKGILQDGIGLVNLDAFQSFKNAINSGTFRGFREHHYRRHRARKTARWAAARLLWKAATTCSLATLLRQPIRSTKSSSRPRPPLASEDLRH